MACKQISAEVEQCTKEHDAEEQAQNRIDAAHRRPLRRDHRALAFVGPESFQKNTFFVD
jgi:hypothetical protein